MTPETREGGLRPGEGRRIVLTGTVQGVGFRPCVYRLAHEVGVRGRVRNDASGVTIDACVPRLRTDHPPAAVVDGLRSARIAAEEVAGFEIEESGGDAERRTAIPPHL